MLVPISLWHMLGKENWYFTLGILTIMTVSDNILSLSLHPTVKLVRFWHCFFYLSLYRLYPSPFHSLILILSLSFSVSLSPSLSLYSSPFQYLSLNLLPFTIFVCYLSGVNILFILNLDFREFFFRFL